MKIGASVAPKACPGGSLAPVCGDATVRGGQAPRRVAPGFGGLHGPLGEAWTE